VDNLGAILPLILLVVAFFFLVLRPARARQRAFLQTQNQLTPGSEVMIASGIFGTIVSLGDETVELRIAPNTVVTVNRQAVARVITPTAAPDTETSTDD
jgi:preprotein translocase subunit YajC